MWQDEAECRNYDPELWFPVTNSPDRKRKYELEPKLICRSCPVRSECLTYALDAQEEYGIWGGLNEEERRELSSRGGRPGVRREVA